MRMSIIPQGHEVKTEEVKWPTVAIAQARSIALKKKKKKKKDKDGDYDMSGQGPLADEDDE